MNEQSSHYGDRSFSMDMPHIGPGESHEEFDKRLKRWARKNYFRNPMVSGYGSSGEEDEEKAPRLEQENRNRQQETHHDPSIDAISDSQPYYPNAYTTTSTTGQPRFPEVHTGLYPHVCSSSQTGDFRPVSAPPQSNTPDGEPKGSTWMRAVSSTTELTRLNSEPGPMAPTQTSVRTGGGVVMFDHFVCSDESKKTAGNKWFGIFKELVIPMFPEKDQQFPVKIAVLDTGIDLNLLPPESRARIRDQKSFVPNEGWIDRVGHGTLVTWLLLAMAYNAHIYVARVIGESMLDTPTHIADAIRYATETWKVDIINMSFGSRSDNAVIVAALKNAYAANVLMFAAARNDGGNFGVAFPARHRDVICIRATDGNGTASSFNPPVLGTDDNFATLGEGVEFSGLASVSGTSYATPVAISIASLVLAYVRENFPEGEKDEVERRLKESPDGMRAALHLMSRESNDRRYIEPWMLFNAQGENNVYIHLSSALKNPNLWWN